MPNWNYTCAYICSKDKNLLNDLRQEFKSHLDRGYNHVSEFMASQDYELDDVYELDSRDHFTWVDPVVNYEDTKHFWYFCMELDQAWGPRLGWLYQYIRDRYGNNLMSIKWLGEESNECIFVSNDYNTDFFLDRFIASGTNLNGESFYEFYETKAGMVEDINEHFKTKFTESDSLANIEDAINSQYADDDADISIRPLELTNEYEDLYFGGEQFGNIVRNGHSIKSAA